MSQSSALQNCVVEKSMPKGYTWAKFIKCWTGDPADARFFEEKTDDVGNVYPCAYFTTIITYDPASGWVQRDVRFKGDEALWAMLELKEKSRIANVSCEGHVYSRVIEHEGGQGVQSSVIVKQGTLSVFAYEDHSSPIPISLPSFDSRPSEEKLEEAPF